MKKHSDKVTIEIDNERFEVDADVQDISQSGQSDDVQIITQQGQEYILRSGNMRHRIKVYGYDPVSRAYEVELDGQLKHVSILRDLDLMIEKMGLNAIHAKKLTIMEAPMPGLVAAIKINVGDHIVKGTPLLILEAMKMENVIAAPHDATIKEIKVSIGQAVERGFPLIEFE